uniref:RNA-directed RNA polymerase catalytic subunit n=1 Tax=Raphidiopteran orthomyxo-related virus OKIAV180 TaxID=2792563 RepID=A0A7T0Q4Q4_9ORTO|nr:polymerase PB1 [Raphidiopteran orthomyxo-related virus OKIAV180]
MSPYSYYQYNSFLVGALLTREEREKHNILTASEPPDLKYLNNLGSVSALYLYTNTPPHGYGSQAPKVAETVNRAYSFNYKKDSSRRLETPAGNVERLQWEKGDGEFPFGRIHGNFIAKEVRIMAEKFLTQNQMLIDQCAEDIIEPVLHGNSDVLTKGRQTLDSLTNSSVTASIAYKRVHDLYKENLGLEASTILDWIKGYFQLMEKDECSIKESDIVENEKIIYNKTNKMYINKRVQRKISKNRRYEGGKRVKRRLVQIGTRFASYIKHKERGKLDRRAIASANMVLRAFFLIIEEFHLSLGKSLPGSTISIGGEEKKRKIISNLSNANLRSSTAKYVIQGTEDATKWNECLSPAVFGIMHKTFFDKETRKRLGLPESTQFGELFSHVAVSGNFLMALKSIQLGLGPIASDDSEYRRLKWHELDRFNENSKDWLREILRRGIDEDNFISASPGMLMGMLNAGSTTLGLLPVNHNFDQEEMSVVTLRSSDDSMSVYMGKSSVLLKKCIAMNKRNLEMVGINLSDKKTHFFKEGFGEFTSWYMDGNFVAQYGVETSSIRPQGKNPPDDFHSIAKGTSTSLSTLSINHLGASAKLRLGVLGVRRLWRIERNPVKREGVSDNVLLLSDGGRSLWNCANCHLEESCLKERYCTNEVEKQYLLRVRNPHNPFSLEPEEDSTYSKELGGLQLTIAETPRSAFHYAKRTNRTATTSSRRDMFKEERAYGESIKMIKSIDPTTNISYPNTSVKINKHLYSVLQVERHQVDLSEEEEELFKKALDILQGIEVVEDEDVPFEHPIPD